MPPKGPKKNPIKKTSSNTEAARKAVNKAMSQSAIGPSIGHKNAVMRDQAIVAMRSQNYSWTTIANEFGLSLRQVQDRYKNMMGAPDVTELKPLDLVSQILREWRGSIAAYDVMASEQYDKNPSVSLGAKKAADELRGRTLAVCADLGLFPQDVSQWRNEAELESLVNELVDLVTDIENGKKGLAQLTEWKVSLSREAPSSATASAEDEIVDGELVDPGR